MRSSADCAATPASTSPERKGDARASSVFRSGKRQVTASRVWAKGMAGEGTPRHEEPGT